MKGTIGEHEILELLGRGGMGSVYRVRHAPTGQELALKILHAHDDLLRFKREFAVCSELCHPGLVRVFELGMHEGQLFYTMELVRGESLRAHPSEAVYLKLLESILYVHRHGVLHRDLKPENVLVDGHGQPRLLDFGLARRHEAVSQELTAPGTVLGTVHYMAPEQVNGAEVDFRADLYSFGVMLYEMASGRLPFERPDLIATLAAILTEDPPTEPLPDDHLKPIILKLLEKDPARRFQSASELWQAWTREPLPAAPPLHGPRFVGRERELARAAELCERPGVVVVEASTGLGKSRFLQELATSLRHPGRVVARVESWEGLLRQALADGLPQSLEPFRADLARILPELGRLEEPVSKVRMFEGMARLLLTLSGPNGLVLLYDDLDKGDQDFALALAVLIAHGLAITLVVTTSTPLSLETTLHLDPLTPAQMRQMAASLAEVPPDFFQETEGNPLFLSELVKTFLTEGRPSREIPRTIRDVLLLRLQRLDPHEREVAHQAAILGRSFSSQVLARCRSLDPNVLERLVARKILHREGDSCSFASSSLHALLLEEIPDPVALHARAASAGGDDPARLARHFRLSGQTERAIALLIEAGDAALRAQAGERALEYYEGARELSPRPELDERLADACALAERLGRAETGYAALIRQTGPGPDRMRLYRKLAEVQERRGDLRAAHATFKLALAELKIKLPSDSRRARLALPLRMLGLKPREEGEELDRCLERVFRVIYMLRPDGWQADLLEVGLRREALGVDQTAPLVRPFALSLVSPWLAKGSLRAIRRAIPATRAGLADGPRKALILNEIAYILLIHGQTTDALRLMHEALELAERVGCVHGLTTIHTVAQLLYRHSGKLDQALDHARKAYQYGERTASLMDLALACPGLALVHALRGEWEQSERVLSEGFDRSQAGGLVTTLALCNFTRAHALFLRGQFVPAVELAKSGQRECQRLSLRYFQRSLEVLEVRALAQAGQRVRALRRLRQVRPRVQEFPVFVALLVRTALEGDRRSAYLEALEMLAAADNLLEQGNTHDLLARDYADDPRAEAHRQRALHFWRLAGLAGAPVEA